MPEKPSFTWQDHAQRIDAQCRAFSQIKQVAAMALPQATWDSLVRLIEREIAIGRATPDEGRDAWQKTQCDL